MEYCKKCGCQKECIVTNYYLECKCPEERGQYLIHAVLNDNIQAIEQYHKRGVDFNYKNDGGHTPLMYAAYFARVEIALFLLERGADPDLQSNQEETALFLLMERYSSDANPDVLRILEYLLHYKADTTIKNYENKSLMDFHIHSSYERIFNKYP